MRISKLGVMITAIAMAVFTLLLFNIVGYWCLISGPIITLFASRPVSSTSGWAWEKGDQ